MTKNQKQHKNVSKNNKQQADSSKAYYIGYSGVRKPTSIRVDTGLWEAFKKTVSRKGLSTCEILEKIILGLTVGIKVSEESVIHPTTINVYAEIPKFVRRVRRAKVEYVDERESETFPCPRFGVFVERDKLPLQECLRCPNRACREYVLSLASKGFGELDE